MTTSSASSASPLTLSEYERERIAYVASGMLLERQGKGIAAPSGVMHSSVKLRKVIERMDIYTGEMTTFYHDDTAPLLRGPVGAGRYPVPGEEHFAQHMLDCYNHNNPQYTFTLTEEEFDHEQRQDS